MIETGRSCGQYYSGTSGIMLPLANKNLYPEEFKDKTRLHFYASLFSSIEINSSFYKLPMAKTIRQWAESVPADFRFTFKLWREITHVKELAFKNEDVDRFMHTIAEVGSKKGTLLVQFPPGLSLQFSVRLLELLKQIKYADDGQNWKIALEFRNECWYTEEITASMQSLGAGVVIHDKLPAANTLQPSEARFRYLRFHGYNGDYKGCYEDDFLYEYAQYIREWVLSGIDVFVYFNNTRGEAVSNLITLNDYVRRNSPDE